MHQQFNEDSMSTEISKQLSNCNGLMHVLLVLGGLTESQKGVIREQIAANERALGIVTKSTKKKG